MAKVHHSAIVCSDLDRSLRFWRDGLGFQVLMDEIFEGPWPELFDAAGTRLRAIFLGDPSVADAGIVELVQVVDEEGAPLPADLAPRPAQLAHGFFLLSVVTDLAATLDRLESLGLDTEARQVTIAGVTMAVVRDPDGVLVELIDAGGTPNLDRLVGD